MGLTPRHAGSAITGSRPSAVNPSDTSSSAQARVAQPPVFGVRGFYFGRTTNLQEGRLPSSSGARVPGRTWELAVGSSSEEMPTVTGRLIVGHPLIIEGGRGISAKADRFRYNGCVEFEDDFGETIPFARG